jgi:hypothetical protein
MLTAAQKTVYVYDLLTLKRNDLDQEIDKAVAARVGHREKLGLARATGNEELEKSTEAHIDNLDERIEIAFAIRKMYEVAEQRDLQIMKETVVIHSQRFFVFQAKNAWTKIRKLVICQDMQVIEIVPRFYLQLKEYIEHWYYSE